MITRRLVIEGLWFVGAVALGATGWLVVHRLRLMVIETYGFGASSDDLSGLLRPGLRAGLIVYLIVFCARLARWGYLAYREDP